MAVRARKLTLACLLAGAALLLLWSPSSHRAGAQEAGPALSNPLAGDGMWIWYVSQSSGGDVDRIAAKAKRRGIEVVLIKGGDGSSTWSQFSASLVDALQARGLRVCAWQYVYGDHPRLEAGVGGRAVKRGADCLVIDAESEYEGRYAQASTYMHRLRYLIGDEYPVGIAGFPYVDYHPSFPYSVFLGPNGAQFNLPQLYWYTIGDKVDWSFSHTYVFNRAYARPIMPLGQVYSNPPPKQIRRFRKLVVAHRMAGVSWWSWQSASGRGWKAIGPQKVRRLTAYQPTAKFPYLKKGARGDIVVWAQQLLAGGGYTNKVTGYYGPITRSAVIDFQTDQGLEPTGAIARGTWRALLELTPMQLRWTKSGAVSAGNGHRRPEPRSAELPAKGYEIPPPSERH